MSMQASIAAHLSPIYKIETALQTENNSNSLYSGWDVQKDRRIVIHALPCSLAGANACLNELSKWRDIQHPNIVSILDIGSLQHISTSGSTHIVYYITDYPTGNTLSNRLSTLAQQPLSLSQILNLALQTAYAFRHLHSKNLNALGLSPSDITILDDQILQILPISFQAQLFALDDETPLPDPLYRAPEHFKNGPLNGDEASDIYFLGQLVFLLSSSTTPFDGDPETLSALHQHYPIPNTLINLGLPNWLDDLVKGCMHKVPNKRHLVGDIIGFIEQKIQSKSSNLNLLPNIPQVAQAKLLFVEDDKIEQLNFARFIKEEPLPYTFRFSRTVKDAQLRLKHEHFDAVISDYMLPDGTASDIIARNNDIPVIVVTGFADENTAAEALRVGACDYLIKDQRNLHFKKLQRSVANALDFLDTKRFSLSLNQQLPSVETEYRSQLSQTKLVSSLHTQLLSMHDKIREALFLTSNPEELSNTLKQLHSICDNALETSNTVSNIQKHIPANQGDSCNANSVVSQVSNYVRSQHSSKLLHKRIDLTSAVAPESHVVPIAESNLAYITLRCIESRLQAQNGAANRISIQTSSSRISLESGRSAVYWRLTIEDSGKPTSSSIRELEKVKHLAALHSGFLEITRNSSNQTVMELLLPLETTQIRPSATSSTKQEEYLC